MTTQKDSTNTDVTEPKSTIKRAYKACLGCRRAKVRCRSTTFGTCERCTRESKPCIFPAERSRKQNSVAWQRHDGSIPATSVTSSSRDRRSDQNTGNSQTTRHETLGLQMTDDLLQGGVASTKDAFNVLFQAASHASNDEVGDLSHTAESRNTVIDGARADVDSPMFTPLSTLPPASESALRHWRRHRFVLQGWFSAREAVAYIDLFALHLARLTPVCSAFRFDDDFHRRLVHEDPLLCCTLLMISTRFHVLSGERERSRTEYLHTRLWRHCEHLINRITFGLEKYSTAKTRTIGSIRALLLITEWHPRALYFPPETEGWDASLALSFEDSFERDEEFETSQHIKWREYVFEPVKRSDRMSWMLLGIAMTLAHELGVFANNADSSDGSSTHLRQLLYIYITQQSLRSGCSSLPVEGIVDLSARDAKTPQLGRSIDFVFLTSWTDITKLMKMSNDILFSRARSVREVVASGQYTAIIDHFRPLLEQWHRTFMSLDKSTMSGSSQTSLLIDYHYCRLFINSVAMQAMIERGEVSSTTGYWLNSSPEHNRDLKCIQQVREASCEILRICIGLAEADELRYCTTRIVLRIVSAAIFLLKSISFGASRDYVDTSIKLLQECTKALQEQRQDDLHLSARFGVLIDRHIRGFRAKFVVQNVQADMNMQPFDPLPHGLGMENSVEGFGVEDWLVQPFDTTIAPFSYDSSTFSNCFGIDSLDFLLNSGPTLEQDMSMVWSSR